MRYVAPSPPIPDTDLDKSVWSSKHGASSFMLPPGGAKELGQQLNTGEDLTKMGNVEPPLSKKVATTTTAENNERRRKTDAKFVCPVPGCGSTSTRHFNLKGASD